jgi:NTP pyrophosphatase (non-canonical NTP hydrolase)
MSNVIPFRQRPDGDPRRGALTPATEQTGAPPVQQTWDTVEQLVGWLDAEQAVPPEMARLLRVLKITEEAGEVAEAVHGATGSNPRKGNSHTWDDVQTELCDVILTSMVALRTITPDAAKVFEGRLAHVARRSLPPGGAAREGL